LIRIGKHLVAISDVSSITTRKPYVLPVALVGAMVASIGTVFWTDIAPIDRALFLGLPALAAAVASRIGTLKVSFAFKDDGIQVHAPYSRVVRIANVIEEALRAHAASKQSQPDRQL
jgi:hypothetical protein